MSIDVSIVGATSKELENMLRSAGLPVASAPVSDLLRLAQPGSKPPRVVVLDLRQRSEVPPALAVMKKEHPAIGVVILAGKLDPALMLEAMRAGVTEWVVDPVRAPELIQAVQRSAGTQVASVSGEVFAVVGAKGGVGATTLAVNIATTLSAVGKARTLLIDLHPSFGDAALFLGAEPTFSLADALENVHRLDEAYLKGIVVKTAAGPDLLASPDRPLAAPIDPRRLRSVVECVARCYRFVVLDVPRTEPALGDTLDLATTITVVATQELAAIRAASRTSAALRLRHGAERVRVVVNRYDRTAELGSEDLERAVGGRVGHLFPSNYRLAIDALNKGRPIVVDNHNKLASAFTAYARSLPGRTTTDAEPIREIPAGLFGRLTGRRPTGK